MYAVDFREAIPGNMIPPDGAAPKVATIEEAIELFSEFAEATGTAYGYEMGSDKEWVSASYGWIYFAEAWDGISYGDPHGLLEFGRNGRISFQSY